MPCLRFMPNSPGMLAGYVFLPKPDVVFGPCPPCAGEAMQRRVRQHTEACQEFLSQVMAGDLLDALCSCQPNMACSHVFLYTSLVWQSVFTWSTMVWWHCIVADI